MARITFLMAVLIGPVSALGGYDKTEWGMTIAQVKELYPNGFERIRQDGRLTYSVVRPVGGMPTAYLNFMFSEVGKLSEVTILVLKAGSTVDFDLDLIVPQSYREAKSNFRHLKKMLEKKYGKPVLGSASQAVWLTSEMDEVMLILKKDEGGDGNLGITSTPHDKSDDGTSGL